MNFVISDGVENGASGTSEMGGSAAREAGDERVKSLAVLISISRD
jgi:hypothetical protein